MRYIRETRGRASVGMKVGRDGSKFTLEWQQEFESMISTGQRISRLWSEP